MPIRIKSTISRSWPKHGITIERGENEFDELPEEILAKLRTLQPAFVTITHVQVAGPGTDEDEDEDEDDLDDEEPPPPAAPTQPAAAPAPPAADAAPETLTPEQLQSAKELVDGNNRDKLVTIATGLGLTVADNATKRQIAEQIVLAAS